MHVTTDKYIRQALVVNLRTWVGIYNIAIYY